MSRQSLVFIVGAPVALVAFLLVFRPLHWDAVRVSGAAFMIVGVGLLTLARVQLGNSFSITPQARALVTTGLYRKMRNPVYVFGAVAIAGVALYLRVPKLLWVLAVMVPLQVVRARAEARTLEEKFGEEYRVWKRTTWF